MRILCIEDNSLTADSLTAFLRDAGHDAYYAGDGLCALTHLAAPSEPLPDAIVLDLRMPGMDGEEFLERLEGNAAWRAIPVILTTAASLDEQAHVRQRYPRVTMLPKPFEPKELVSRLETLVGGKP